MNVPAPRAPHRISVSRLVREGRDVAYVYEYGGREISGASMMNSVWGPLTSLQFVGEGESLILSPNARLDVRPRAWCAWAHDVDPRSGNIAMGRVRYVDGADANEALLNARAGEGAQVLPGDSSIDWTIIAFGAAIQDTA